MKVALIVRCCLAELGGHGFTPSLLVLVARLRDATCRADLGTVQMHGARYRNRFVDIGVLERQIAS